MNPSNGYQPYDEIKSVEDLKYFLNETIGW